MEHYRPHPPTSSWITKRVRSFGSAFRGLTLFLHTTPSSWIQFLFFIVALGLGVYFHIERMEFIVIFLVSGLVFVAEAVNTAFEIDIDLTSPQYHDLARDAKDVAAGAVLIASLIAVFVGAVIFTPYVFAAFS